MKMIKILSFIGRKDRAIIELETKVLSLLTDLENISNDLDINVKRNKLLQIQKDNLRDKHNSLLENIGLSEVKED